MIGKAKLVSHVLALLIVLGATPTLAGGDSWTPPENDTKDWIKLVSGEWVRGEIKLIGDDTITFDSEELDDLTIDGGDAAEIHCRRVLTWAFEDDTEFTGIATVMNDQITIIGEAGTETRPRSTIFAAIEGRRTERNYWSGNIHFGTVLRAGNTNQADFNTLVRFRRQTTRNRSNMQYAANFGKVEDQQNINNHNVQFTHDVYLTRRFFVTPASLNLLNDKFQNIGLRTTIAAGAGYTIVKNPKVDWDLSLGAGYQRTDYHSVQEGEADLEETGALIPAIVIETEPTGDLDFDISYSGQISVPDIENSFHHTAIVLSIEVWNDDITLDLTFNWDHVQNPRAAADGTIPERNDFRTAFGFGLEL